VTSGRGPPRAHLSSTPRCPGFAHGGRELSGRPDLNRGPRRPELRAKSADQQVPNTCVANGACMPTPGPSTRTCCCSRGRCACGGAEDRSAWPRRDDPRHPMWWRGRAARTSIRARRPLYDGRYERLSRGRNVIVGACALLACAALVAATRALAARPSIIGGQDAVQGQFPFMRTSSISIRAGTSTSFAAAR
jgi:hypothetical protein